VPGRDDEGQRIDGAPSPAGEVGQIEWRPGGEAHQLGRHARHAVPRIDTEEREPDLREDSRFHDAALIDDESQRGPKSRRRRVNAEHAQRDVRLDGRAQVARTVVVQRPRPVLALGAEDVADRAFADVVV
jgi:hypothetical protein